MISRAWAMLAMRHDSRRERAAGGERVRFRFSRLCRCLICPPWLGLPALRSLTKMAE
jgi:hypothetical protein